MDSDARQHGHESELTYLRHSDIPHTLDLNIKLAALEGTLPQSTLSRLLDEPPLKHAGANQLLPSDLYITVTLWSDNKQLVPSFQSSHKQFKRRDNYTWNEHLTLPIKYRDLPLDSQLCFTVYDIAGPRQPAVVGGTTMRLFGKKHTLKKGKQRLYLWRGTRADGSSETRTPSKIGLKDEMGRLEKLVKKHERGDITRMDWLDKLAFRQIEKIHAVRRGAVAPSNPTSELTTALDLYRPSRQSQTTSFCTWTCQDSTFPSSSASP